MRIFLRIFCTINLGGDYSMYYFKTPWCAEVLKTMDWRTFPFTPNRMIERTTHTEIFVTSIESFSFVVKRHVKEAIHSIENVIREIECHSKVLHPNVIKLYGVYEDKEAIHLVMEYARMDLRDYINRKSEYSYLLNKNLTFPEKYVVKHFLHPLLSAIYHLHSLGIVHHNIRPEHVLMGFDGNWKLCNFGSASKNEKGSRSSSPDILKRFSVTREDRSDIWGAGIIILELLCNHSTYRGNHGGEEYNTLSHEARSFLHDVLHIEAANRPTSYNLLKHCFVLKYIDTETKMRHYNTLLYKNILHNSIVTENKGTRLITPNLFPKRNTSRLVRVFSICDQSSR